MAKNERYEWQWLGYSVCVSNGQGEAVEEGAERTTGTPHPLEPILVSWPRGVVTTLNGCKGEVD